MKSEEPTTRLVNSFIDEVGWEECRRYSYSLVGRVYQGITISLLAHTRSLETIGINLSFEWIMQLCVWHRTAIKPYINQVALTVHRLTLVVNEYDVIHIRAMEIYLIIVFFAIITHYEACFLQWILLHDTCCNCLLYLIVEFFY